MIVTCLESCSSHSLYRVKNFLASSILSIKPQLASFTLIMICLSGTIIATERKLIFRFSGSSCLPAYPGFCTEEKKQKTYIYVCIYPFNLVFSHRFTQAVMIYIYIYIYILSVSVSSGRSRESSLHQLILSWSHLPIGIRHLSRHSYISSIQY